MIYNKEDLAWIKDFAKLQSMDDKTSKMHWCSQCYESQQKWNNYLKLCMNHEAVKTILPEKVHFIGMGLEGIF